MKNLIILFFIPFFSFAKGISLSFDKMPLPNAINIIYSEVLHRPFMLSPELVNDTRLTTFNLTDDVDQYEFINRYFNNLNIKMNTVKGIDYLVAFKPIVKPVETNIFTYLPKYRSVSYLSDILSSQISGVFNSTGSITNSYNLSNGDVNPNSASGQFSRSGDLFVYRGIKENIKLIKELLPKIDIPVDEVIVTGYVLEVSSSSSEGSGLSIIANLFNKKLGIDFNSTYNAGSGNTISFKTDSFTALAELFNKDSHFNILTSPQLRVKNGSSASFSVGSDVPVLGNVTYQDSKPIQSIEYKSSGVLFDITPNIRGDSIDLSVKQQISNFVKTENGVNNSPTLVKRDVNTQISINSGDVVLLGGLAENKNSNNAISFSFLPFLKSQGKEISKTDIVLVLYTEKIKK